jgi:hypothetical protein
MIPGRDHPPPTLAEIDRWADAVIPVLLWADWMIRPRAAQLSLRAVLDARAGKAGTL